MKVTGLHDDNNKQELHTKTLTRMNRAASKGRNAKSSRGQQSPSSKVEVCNDPECKELAKHVLSTMDLSADPCKDFVQYSCALLADPSKSSSKAIQFVKDLYKKCMDTTTISKQKSKSIHKFLRDVGGWPILMSNWDEKSANLQQLFGKIFQWSHAFINNDILRSPFTLRLSVHTENTRKYYFDFRQHETIIGVFFNKNKKNDPKINAYKKLFTKFVSLIATDMRLDVNNNQMNLDWSKINLEKLLEDVMEPGTFKKLVKGKSKTLKCVYGVKNESLSSLCAKRCKSVGMATTALYIKKYFPPTEKAEAESMIAELKNEVRKGLPKLSWMDDATKKKALEKLDMIDSVITYPDYALTDQALDQYYNKLPMKSSDTYFDMLMAVNTFNRKNTFNMLSKPPDRRLLYDPLLVSLQLWCFWKSDSYGFAVNDRANSSQSENTVLIGSEKLLTNPIFPVDSSHGIYTFRAYKSYISKAGRKPSTLPGLNLTDEQLYFVSDAQILHLFLSILHDTFTNAKNYTPFILK
uniref:Peptidase M13 N-terminal domain-containing protein n=1 Tax=Romanomermis culicivorax TaxID=13658 RepID=A0A915JWV1_ROMCU